MAVSCKYDSDSNTEGDTIERKVLKVWRDDGNEEKRPEQIVVQLLRDGEVYDTVTLSNDNNWRYTWPELSADHHWAGGRTPDTRRLHRIDRTGRHHLCDDQHLPAGYPGYTASG